MEQSDRFDAEAAGLWLARSWAEGLAQVLESMTGERPEVEAVRADETPSQERDALCWEQGFDLCDGPAAWALLPEPLWRGLGGRTLRAAGVEAADAAETKSACHEILSQSFASLAQALGARLGRVVTAAGGAERDKAPVLAPIFVVAVRFSQEPMPAILAGFSPRLAEVLAAPGEAPPPEIEAAAVPGAPAAFSSRTFDLLLEVELPVSISFGRAHLPLEDVLKLTAGSIVELNRTIDEPVELIVNNSVVALGEVVVVDGNYGVRIRQIASREDRLRTSSESLGVPKPHGKWTE